ncbi:dynein regulatory complex protein 10 isoform X1 [Epinephelus fuscoguttatus]|uniref:dynein regulatory complex protein 10 isoform X1 n=2 Tax=Epinephelus fuscoguttatus TaxID=293821 RepID=UPI0020D1E315|nr:dynein regulatory complex protein 10 isoform X1 [Epinephelus fuscoguttatus]
MQLTVNNIQWLQTAHTHICVSMSTKGATLLAKTQSKDALQNHELSLKKLLSPEAQRISSILENCIRQAEIAATLPAVLLNSTSVMDKELTRALEKHRILGERLETLVGLKQESDGGQGERVGEARVRLKAQLQRDIKNSVRDLLRLFRDYPDAISGLRSEPGVEVGESEAILIRGLEKFHSHVVEKLVTSPQKEVLQLISHEQVSSFPAQDLAHVILLEEEGTAAIKEVDAEISQTNVEIEKLQSALRENNRQEADISLLADKQCQAHIKSAKMKHASIQQEIDQLNSQLNSLTLEDGQAERVIQEEIEKVVTEIEYLLQTFDSKIQEVQANLESNEMEQEREMEELRELDKPFSVLEVEHNQIQEKRRLAEEKRREEMVELELKTKAAILAQAWWRGYSTRKALKNKGKSKKAKKGKGKKTK